MPSPAELNHLRAVDEHLHQQAEVYLEAVNKIGGKVDRARYSLAEAEQQLLEAKETARLAYARAREARRIADEAGAPAQAIPSMTVTATPTP